MEAAAHLTSAAPSFIHRTRLQRAGMPFGALFNLPLRCLAPDRRHKNWSETMKIKNSLKALKVRHRENRMVRRRGRVYIINKSNPRFKARQG